MSTPDTQPSETPITDEVLFSCPACHDMGDALERASLIADHARDLEAKLHAAEAEVAELQLKLSRECSNHDVTRDVILEAECRVDGLQAALAIANASADDQMFQKREAEAALAAERQKREEAEKDSAFVRDKVREFGSTLGKWFPELHMPEQFALERGILIAREFIKAKDELSTLRAQNTSQAQRIADLNKSLEIEQDHHDQTLQAQANQKQRIAELMALVGEMRRAVKRSNGGLTFHHSYKCIDHGAECICQTDDLVKSWIAANARADAILSGQPAPSPWRPMSEAPKDGTVILVSPGYSDQEDKAWWDGSNWGDDEHYWTPDFWMPLPPVSKEPSR